MPAFDTIRGNMKAYTSAAAADQRSSNIYTFDKDWEPSQLDSGSRVYRLDFYDDARPEGDKITGASSYYIDEETYNHYLRDDGSFDVKQYCSDAQIAPYPDHEANTGSYKNHISAFEVQDGESVDCETGIAEANKGYGDGGARQYYIPSDQESKLQPLEGFESPTITEEDRTMEIGEAFRKLDDNVECKAQDERLLENPSLASDESQLALPSGNDETMDKVAQTAHAPESARNDENMDHLAENAVSTAPVNDESKAQTMDSIAPKASGEQSESAAPAKTQTQDSALANDNAQDIGPSQ